jgi:hypothetical protein
VHWVWFVKRIGFGLLTLYALGQCGLFCLLIYMQWVLIAIDFGALLGPYLICLCIGEYVYVPIKNKK